MIAPCWANAGNAAVNSRMLIHDRVAILPPYAEHLEDLDRLAAALDLDPIRFPRADVRPGGVDCTAARNNRAAERLGRALEPRRRIYGVSNRRVIKALRRADVADDRVPGVH